MSNTQNPTRESVEQPRRRRKKRAPAAPPLGLQILREPEVMQFSALPRSQLWKHVKNGTFPKPVRLSDQGRAVGWLLEELLAWREQRIATREDQASQAAQAAQVPHVPTEPCDRG
jgi:prophage regulatory protein